MAAPAQFPPAKLELRRFGLSTVSGTLQSINPVGVRALLILPPPRELEPGTKLKLRFPAQEDFPDVTVVLARVERRSEEYVLVLGFGENRLDPDQMKTLASLMDQRGATRYPAPTAVSVGLEPEEGGVRIEGRLLDLSVTGLGVGCSDTDASAVQVGSSWVAHVGQEEDLPAFEVRVRVRGLRKSMGTWALGLEVLKPLEPGALDPVDHLLERVRSWRENGLVPFEPQERKSA